METSKNKVFDSLTEVAANKNMLANSAAILRSTQTWFPLQAVKCEKFILVSKPHIDAGFRMGLGGPDGLVGRGDWASGHKGLVEWSYSKQASGREFPDLNVLSILPRVSIEKRQVGEEPHEEGG